jgi:hypothetical protein
MANYTVNIFNFPGFGGDPGQTTWTGVGSTSESGAYELQPGDTVQFKKSGMGTITMSSFGSNLWTNTSNLTLTSSYQTKTVKTGGTVGSADGVIAGGGVNTLTRYFKMGGASADLSIGNIDDISRPNGSTNFSITFSGTSSHTVYEVHTTSSSGTVVGTTSSDGSLTISNMPSSGFSRTYYVTGRRPSSQGGSNTPTFILSFTVTHESPGSSITDGGTGTYGLRVLDSSGGVLLDLTDRVIVFSDHVTGSLTASQLSKNVTLAKAATCIIDLDPETVLISNGLAQRQHITHTTVTGTSLTIARNSIGPGFQGTGGTGQSTTYNFLAVLDPD